MKNVKLLTLMLFVGLFIGGNGCRKDEVPVDSSVEVVIQSRTNHDLDTAHIEFLEKRPFINDCYNQLPSDTWSKEAILSSLGLYSDLLCTFGDEMTKIGNPLWSATIFDLENQSTLTPIIGSENSVKGMFNVKYTSDTVYYMVYDGSLYFHEEDNTVIKYLDDAIFERGDGGGICEGMFRDKGILHYRAPWYSRIDFGEWGGNAGYSGGFIRTGGGGGGAGPSGPGGGGYSGGGGAGSIGYINPRGRSYSCDIRLTTVEGCENFIKNQFGQTWFEAEDVTQFQDKINKCGCWYAAFHAKGNWDNMSEGEKCFECMPINTRIQNQDEAVMHMTILADFLKSIKVVCQGPNELVESLKADLYDRACQGLLYGQSGLTPMVEINNLMKKLEEAGIEYTSMIRHFIFEGMNGEIGPSSAGIEKMIEMFGLTAGDMDSMDDTALCRKWESYECIRKSFLQVEGENTMSEEQKAVLDWYNNTSLIDPCSGEEINKDDILQQACVASPSGITMDAIDKALEGVDNIEFEWESINKLCPKFKCVYDHLNNTGNKLFCKTIFDKFYYDENVKLIFRASNQGGGGGGTSYSENGKIITIRIDKTECDNPLNLAATLIHEGIHAFLFNELRVQYPKLKRDNLRLILEKNKRTSDPSHEVMAKKYINLLANALREADGNRFSADYYMYLAWSGVTRAGHQLGLVSEFAGEHLPKHEILMAQPSTFCE